LQQELKAKKREDNIQDQRIKMILDFKKRNQELLVGERWEQKIKMEERKL